MHSDSIAIAGLKLKETKLLLIDAAILINDLCVPPSNLLENLVFHVVSSEGLLDPRQLLRIPLDNEG